MTEQIKDIESALQKVKDQKENFGFMDRFTVDENWEVTKALEKQIPKKAIRSKEPRYGMGEEYYDWICPTCGEWLAYSPDRRRYEIHHCRCGQKLDWGEEE